MRTELKKLPDSMVEVEVELSPEEMRPYLARAAEDITKERPIEGFRPGKAPMEVVKERYGEAALYEYALKFAVNGSIPQVIAEEKIHMVGTPEVAIKKLAPGNPLIFSVKSAVMPEFSLPDVEAIARKIVQTKKKLTAEEKEIDEAITWLREERAETKPAERPAKVGDAVEIDFNATVDGAPVGSGESKNHPLVIGKGTMVPGFEEKLVGMAKGEEKKFSLEIPKTHPEPTIAGKTMEVAVSMTLVEERILPEPDDLFAKSVGKFETLAELRKNIKEGLEEEKAIKENNRIRIAIADAIAEKTSIELPNVLVQNELEKMFLELRNNIESMGMDYGGYLTHLKKTEEQLKTEWRADAIRRVKIALILRKIGELKSIDPTTEEVDEEVKRVLSRFKSREDAEKEIDPEALQNYARGVARNEKVFQWLESL